MIKEANDAMVKVLAEIKEGIKADEALKLSQAALNLAHVQSVISNLKSNQYRHTGVPLIMEGA
jgi:hypothetical protein